MRRQAKRIALMLVLSCVVVATPPKVDAGLWQSLIELTWTEPVEGPLYVLNETGRPVRIRMWSNQGDYSKCKMTDGQVCGFSAGESQGTWFAVEAAVWNKNIKRYVVMAYVEGPAFQHYIFYKHTQGDFRLKVWP